MEQRSRCRWMVGLTVAMAGLLVLGAASPAGAIGELDPTFSTDGRQTANFTGGADPGLAAAVQVDGKILAAGRAGGSGGRMFVSRYNSNGTLDSSFSGDGRAFVDFGPGDDYAADIAIDDDDAIVIVGGAQSRRRIGVARFTANGVPDTTFSGDGKRTSNLVSGNEWADDLVLDSSGRLVVGGVAEFSGVGRFVLVRYNADGSLDTTFSGDGWISADIAPGYDALLALALQGDGKLVASGLVESAAEMRMTVARFTSNGTLDTTFSGDGKRAFNTAAGYEEAAGVAVQDDGKIVMGGESKGRLVLVRLSSTGVPDPAFSGDGIQITNRGRGPEWIGDLRLQDDGKIVIGGVQGGNGGRMLLGRYLTNGDPDTSFSGDGFTPIDFSPRFDIAWDVAIQPDGRIVGVGSADSDQRVALARVVGG